MARILLVEGIDDQHVVWNLAKHYNMPESFRIEQKQGYTNVLKVLPVQIKASDVEAVGVLLDADVDFLGRWASVRGALEKSGYTALPDELPPAGLVVEMAGLPRVGVWLMPDNSAPGMLEDFVAKLVPEEDVLMPVACQAVSNIVASEIKFAPQHKCKAEIHTWLAWQEDPGTPFGLAITKKYLDPDNSTSKIFIKWLEDTFVGGF